MQERMLRPSVERGNTECSSANVRISVRFFFVFAGVAALLIAYAAPFWAFAETSEERRARLEQELMEIEKDIAAKKGNLTELQRQRTSLERDVAILDSKIETARLSIKQRDISITKLRDGIADKHRAIAGVDQRVLKSEESLAQLIRRTREIDDVSLAELALGEGTVSRFFEEIDNFEQIQSALDVSFKEMAVLRADLAARKEALEGQQVEEQDLRQIQVLQKQAIEKDEKEKKTILTVTKGQEKAYQQLIAERERQAATIRSALFGLRDSSAIPFGKAYEYAKEASAKTGVRPAVILAILREETNLGENVGTGNWKTDMHPTRDQPVFAQITAELGLNPDSMPVSRKPGYGWGGAMGPAQFIPSTWILYKDRIGKATGENPPNPWTARTAIFATSLLMMDNGADGGTYATERKAALKYFAGGNWSKPAYAFYGDDVMEFAESYQRDINILEGK
ncbi:MAG: peptidase M23 [Parcubacteria group bacterium Gr01-1014_8]|nr:MAG: peptidase M23 [Parcubacteria group bacterium Gr01-1014_8]